MDIEIWKPITGFDGYEVSDFGRVRSLDRVDFGGRHLTGKILRPVLVGRGMSVSLRRDGLTHHRLVRRLVMLAFAPPLPADAEVVNLNGVEDNRLSSLVWRTTGDRMAALNKYREQVRAA